jgi:Na+(H+)/acetate symporter ActP
MCEVMMDKAMKDGLQHRDDQSALKEKWRKTFMMQMGLMNGRCVTKNIMMCMMSNNSFKQSRKHVFFSKVFVIFFFFENHFSSKMRLVALLKKLSTNPARKLVRCSKKNITCRKNDKCDKVIKCILYLFS